MKKKRSRHSWFDKSKKSSYRTFFLFHRKVALLILNCDAHCSLFQEVSRNPNLTEDDAAVLVAAHIKSKQPKNYGYYRVGAIRDLGGSHKLTPKMDPQLRLVSRQLDCLNIKRQ